MNRLSRLYRDANSGAIYLYTDGGLRGFSSMGSFTELYPSYMSLPENLFANYTGSPPPFPYLGNADGPLQQVFPIRHFDPTTRLVRVPGQNDPQLTNYSIYLRDVGTFEVGPDKIKMRLRPVHPNHFNDYLFDLQNKVYDISVSEWNSYPRGVPLMLDTKPQIINNPYYSPIVDKSKTGSSFEQPTALKLGEFIYTTKIDGGGFGDTGSQFKFVIRDASGKVIGQTQKFRFGKIYYSSLKSTYTEILLSISIVSDIWTIQVTNKQSDGSSFTSFISMYDLCLGPSDVNNDIFLQEI